MVDVIGRAKVVIVGDVDNRSIDQAGGKIGSVLKTGAAVGVAALGTLAVAGGKAFLAFEEAESIQNKLNNTLANMGKQGAVESVNKISDALMKKTGIDDEVIKKGQTILATFSEVASSVGEIGGSFERATELSLDLAVSGFGSVDSASKALGKALQDPEKGIAALNRAGVTFTPVQKQQIEDFVKGGEVAKAQGLILDEVAKQVGGNAEAGAKGSDKLRNAFGELEESIGHVLNTILGEDEGGGLAGAIDKLADKLDALAESEDLKTFGKDLRDTSHDLATIAGYMASVYKWGNKIADATPGWGSKWKLFTPPIRIFLEIIERATDALKEYWEWHQKVTGGRVTGDDVPDAPDIGNPQGTAVGGPAGGLTLVGERGPELLQLPQGSYVHNAPATQSIIDEVRAASGGGNTQNYYITGPVSLAELRQRAAWYDTYGTRFG